MHLVGFIIRIERVAPYTSLSAISTLHIQEYLAVQLHVGNENVNQLSYTTVHSMMMGQQGLKHLGVGVLY